MPQGPEFIRCDYPNPLPGRISSQMCPLSCGQVHYHHRANDKKRQMTITKSWEDPFGLDHHTIKWGKAETNPVKEVKLAKENNQRIRYLSYEEEERLIGACKGASTGGDNSDTHRIPEIRTALLDMG